MTDHSKAAKDLAKYGIDVFASKGTFDALGLAGHGYHVIEPLVTVYVGTFRIQPFDVNHDAAEPLGFLIETMVTGDKLLYFSDTAYVRYRFPGLTHIVAECNHGDEELRGSVREGAIDKELAKRITRNHMSLERFVEFLRVCDKTRLKQVHLIHLSDNNSNAERFLREVQRTCGTEVYVH